MTIIHWMIFTPSGITTMSSEVIMKNKINKKRHLSEDVPKEEENIIRLRRDGREHLVFPKTVRKNGRERTSRDGNIRI